MELKLAPQDKITKKSKLKKEESITITEIIKNAKTTKIYYFDRTNSPKDIEKAKKMLEKEGLRVQFNETRFGLDENDYIYELHIV